MTYAIKLYVLILRQVDYQKDAEKTMHRHNLPLDYPEFIRAKESAKNASDVSNNVLLSMKLYCQRLISHALLNI